MIKIEIVLQIIEYKYNNIREVETFDRTILSFKPKLQQKEQKI